MCQHLLYHLKCRVRKGHLVAHFVQFLYPYRFFLLSDKNMHYSIVSSLSPTLPLASQKKVRYVPDVLLSRNLRFNPVLDTGRSTEAKAFVFLKLAIFIIIKLPVVNQPHRPSQCSKTRTGPSLNMKNSGLINRRSYSEKKLLSFHRNF